jgi:hypothetical protein
MNDNGSFRKKNGFTIAGNTLTRDKRLSLKSKGLYLLIMSYITFEDITLTKSFILSLCTEKEKAFESIWNELKEKGYLKVYLQPSSKGWHVEYELLDEPKEGAHTFYLTASGEISCTNLDRENNRKSKEEKHIPQKGTNAKGSYAKDNNAEGCNASGGNNISTLNNTSNKTINISHSFIHDEERMTDEELSEMVEEELDRNDGIPYEYSRDINKMTSAIHYITDWNTYYPNGYQDIFFQRTFNLAIEALIEMASETGIKTYNKRRVTYANVIDKINQSIKGQPCKSIHSIIESAVEDYIKAANKNEIKYPRNYIKSCILDNFDTYEVKLGSYFNRTYYST